MGETGVCLERAKGRFSWRFRLCHFVPLGPSRCRYARRGAMQGSECNSALPVIDQSPVRGAVITEPVVLDTPLLLPGPNKWRYCGFSWLGHAVGLDQKQLALSKPQEGLATL